MTACRCAARRTRRPARNGGAAGIPERVEPRRGRPSDSGGRRRAGRARMRADAWRGAAIEVTLAEAAGQLWRPAHLRGDGCRASIGLAPRRRLPARPAQGDEPMSSLYPESLLERRRHPRFRRRSCGAGDRSALARTMRYSPMEILVGSARRREGVMTPDDIAAGMPPEGPIVVFDFDNYYMGERDHASIWRGAGHAGHLCHAGGLRRPPGRS